MQLSAQSIAELCDASYERQHLWHYCASGTSRDRRPSGRIPMIFPFLAEKVVINGASAGLSAASYDIRIAHDLELPPNPASRALRAIQKAYGDTIERDDLFAALVAILEAPSFALAHSLEDFALPSDVAGYVCDKSTYARRGVSAFNTLFDPGFRGNATLELVNLSDREVFIKAGDPICQLVFHRLDRSTDRPYEGKYQDQPKAAVGAIMELVNENRRTSTGFQVDRP